MTEKRFKHSEIVQDDGQTIAYGIEDTKTRHIYNVIGEGIYEVSEKALIDLLNEQNETITILEKEKEEWKHSAIKQADLNSILWNEISIMREQGAKPSDSFKEYLDGISTEYDKFWDRKKEKARESMVILND